jgi:L-alanine-DL-glutamate epimerase-like enolase superfamily enzyme
VVSPKIRAVQGLKLRLPFDHGGDSPVFAGQVRNTLDSLLVRVELDDGSVGWGEAYGGELDAVASMLRHRVAPLAVGCDPADASLMPRLERTLHNLGRGGIVLHALSGLDIALWDLRGKLAGVPVSTLLGGRRHDRVPAYASLLQYNGDLGHVRRNVERALAAGFREVKLHERTAAAAEAARAAMGDGVPMMVDTNCAWLPAQAVEAVRAFVSARPLWIEEPIWPPEDGAALVALRAATGQAVAVGENASSLHGLLALVDAHAVDWVQPAAIKAGGLTALLAVAQRCEGTPVRCSPQTAFFGPGFLATLQWHSAQPNPPAIERLYCGLGATPYAKSAPLVDGHFILPEGPGLGADPEPSLIDGPFVTRLE